MEQISHWVKKTKREQNDNVNHEDKIIIEIAWHSYPEGKIRIDWPKGWRWRETEAEYWSGTGEHGEKEEVNVLVSTIANIRGHLKASWGKLSRYFKIS